ncbi:hypothetical protein EZ313_21985 [Ramlibacter henchirensis]|uniref:Uncharacterized protein n=1 Tax=Ramlibacter henchirensis TaxID=204072 RepID=A0A4Z0BLF5_9BURK|nr:hypothetical protein [Ramlibacter henchirensis]TFY99239.1 hypothetical protein EZ313_21985 [Ramlibacter henchirensis]
MTVDMEVTVSGKCTGLVWDKYPGGGDDFKLALALSDSADDSGYVYIEATLRLLHQARVTEAEFRGALAVMKDKGWLRVIDANECLFQLGAPSAATRGPKMFLVPK